MQDQKNSNSSTTSTIQTSPSNPSHSVRYPYLQNALKVAYREKDSLPMPLVGGSFPIQAVSLTINVKEKQQERDQDLTQGEEQETKEKNKKTITRAQKRDSLHALYLKNLVCTN
jgi:hypothetical protein